jgi:hypothetical protein
MEEIMGNWRELYSEGLHDCTDKYFSVDEIELDKMGGVCGTNGENRNVYIILMGKHEMALKT